jgi:hypothetical protein
MSDHDPKSLVHQLFHLFGTDTDSDLHALDADTDPDHEADPTRSGSTTLRRSSNIISEDCGLIYLKKDQFITKIVKEGNYV